MMSERKGFLSVALLGALAVFPGAQPSAPAGAPAAPATAAPATPAAPAVSATPPKEEFPPFKGFPVKLTEGERLTYKVKWEAVDAGLATLTVKRKEQLGPGGPEVWNIQCRTRSNAFVSMFYEVRDDIKTFLDAKEGFTRLFDMNKNEGSTHNVEHIEFDYDKAVANYTKTNVDKDTGKDKVKAKTIALPGKVHDPLSCLYYIRGLDLKVGGEYKLTVNTSKKNWVLTLRVVRREEQFIEGIGKVNALVIEPEAQFQGIFVRKGKMTVWVEEQTKVALMVKAAVPIGSASAVLVNAENSPLSKLKTVGGDKK